jgi:signal transduction histidine kinase
MQKQAFIPKARLIQILGEHLIKDATVGLLELIKNSYDADAKNVEVKLSSLGTPKAKIQIMDDGYGMDTKAFLEKWMNPASGHKQIQKERQKRTTLGRLPLGEKGVGRFAAQQIGNNLQLLSKTKEMKEELCVKIDWTDFDDPDKDLNEVKIEYATRDPLLFNSKKTGMYLEITNLKAQWSEREIERLSNSLMRMKSPFKGADDFNIKLTFEDCPEYVKKYEDLGLSDILEKANYKFYGIVDQKGLLEYEYNFNIPGLKKTHREGRCNLIEEFGNIGKDAIICGGFILNFHVYDLSSRTLKNSGINDRELIRDICGISVFRDGMRILPYGEPGNDWLKLDYRRIQRPGQTFSNDQVIGMVEINQTENPNLIDKTNREGLIENDEYRGFKQLIFGAIEVLEVEMLDDRKRSKPSKEKDPQEEIEKAFSGIKTFLQDIIDKAEATKDQKIKDNAGQIVSVVQKGVEDLKISIGDQVDIFEIERNTLLNLAGTGLAAERFTHEFARIVSGANAALERLVRRIATQVEDDPKTKKEIDIIRVALEALRNDIRLLGPMFYVKKAAREKELDIKQIIDNTISLQEISLEKGVVDREVIGDSFVVVMREGSCMQVFNNLFDNSIYWLSKKTEKDRRQIKLILDKKNKAVYFSDNGPGVVSKYQDKIFEPFFSMKGEEGRGLGLYIASEIMQEKKWGIFLVDKDEYPGLLNGANFKIVFGEKHE